MSKPESRSRLTTAWRTLFGTTTRAWKVFVVPRVDRLWFAFSQWLLDMTPTIAETTFGLYMAVLKKTDPSPLLPESDEDRGVGTGRSRPAPARAIRREGGAPGGGAGGEGEPTDNVDRGGPVTVQVDFDGPSQRIIAVPGVPERQYTDLQAAIDGSVFYMEAGRAPGSGNDLQRYRLCDRRANTVSGVALRDQRGPSQDRLSRRGRRWRAVRGPGGGGGTRRRRSCSSSMRISIRRNLVQVV